MEWLKLSWIVFASCQWLLVAFANADDELNLFSLAQPSFVAEGDTRFVDTSLFNFGFDDESELIVVGNPLARKDDFDGADVGVVQVFRFFRGPNAPFNLEKLFDLQGIDGGDRFGIVAINGTTLFVGDYGPKGSVFVYEKQEEGDTWDLNATLTTANIIDSPNSGSILEFGLEVQAAKDLVLVTGYEEGRYRKYLFQKRSDGEWEFVRSIVELDHFLAGYFDQNMIIGRPYYTFEAIERRRIRIVTPGSGGLWDTFEEVVIEHADDSSNRELGGIDDKDGMIVVGLPRSESASGFGGFVVLQQKVAPDPVTNWTQSARITLNSWDSSELFGRSVLLMGDKLLLGGDCPFGFFAFTQNETNAMLWDPISEDGYNFGACIRGLFKKKYLVLSFDTFINALGPKTDTVRPTLSPTNAPLAAPSRSPTIDDGNNGVIISGAIGGGVASLVVVAAVYFTIKNKFGAIALDRGCRYHFFLSHRQQGGGEKASLLKEWLESYGYRIWLDQAQDDLTHDKMLKGIEETSMYLLLLTPGVFESAAVKMELQHAINLNKPFVMVHVPSFTFSIQDNVGCPLFMETLFKTHNSIEFTRREIKGNKLVVTDLAKRYTNRATYKPGILPNESHPIENIQK